jgi:2-keto-4-pentenoate hydratase/2-oxohepta-3-ene-1,7-dioic acid hydratase in catechol pathway
MATSTPTPFALGTFRARSGPPFAAVVVDARAHPLPGTESVAALVADWDRALPRLQRIADESAATDDGLPVPELTPCVPLAPVGQIFQAGANYRTHVLELYAAAERRGDASDGITDGDRGRARRALDGRATNGAPFVFQGSAHALCGATDEVVLPAGSAQPDWELELAAVIGRPARHVSVDDALDHVAGYTIANDLTLRDRLVRADIPGGLDWLAAKNPPTFLPLGPVIVPACHVGDPMALGITLRVNGETMQDASTADMMFGVAELVAYLSRVTELRPGDLVLTGSPPGNGAHHGRFLADGDVLEGRIERLGIQRNRCRAERPGDGAPVAPAGGRDLSIASAE